MDSANSTMNRRRPLLRSLALTTLLLSGVASAGASEAADEAATARGGRRLRHDSKKKNKDTKDHTKKHDDGKQKQKQPLSEEFNTKPTAESEDSNDFNRANADEAAGAGLDRPLLDFAVIGFPKTGTSFMEHYLFNTEETFIDNQENCFSDSNSEKYITKLKEERHYELGQTTEDGYRVKNAVKCPKELLGPNSLANYEEHFPDIKFVISTRHPVWWFQSRYNYKLRQTFKHSDGAKIWAPPPSDLMGPCADGAYHYGMSGPFDRIAKEAEDPNFVPREPMAVCTDGAKFHHTLSRLGKTPMDEAEKDLLGRHEMSVHTMPKAKIFLMEIGQFSVDDPILADQLLQDMKDFLGLEHDLPPLVDHESKVLKEEVQEHAINICDSEHALLRSELVQTGTEAYHWVRDYFLESPDVVVSSRDHFLDLIEKWQYDPCDEAIVNML